MKCLLVLSAVLAYCAAYTLRVPSQYKDGVKWELRADGIGDSSQAGTVSEVYKNETGLAVSVKEEEEATTAAVATETGYEKYLVEPPFTYEELRPSGYKKPEPIPEGIHIVEPPVPGLYQEPSASVERCKELPTQQAADTADDSAAAIRTAESNSAEINARPVTPHQQTVHSVPAHHVYYLIF